MRENHAPCPKCGAERYESLDVCERCRFRRRRAVRLLVGAVEALAHPDVQELLLHDLRPLAENTAARLDELLRRAS